ncbi:KaiC domain-containing protein [Natrialbaceae archaeon A-CW3]
MSDELEDDWFERALDERAASEKEDTDPAADEPDGEGRSDEGNEDATNPIASNEGDGRPASRFGDGSDGSDGSDDGGDGSDDGGGTLFDTDFASALEDVTVPEMAGPEVEDNTSGGGPTSFDDLDFELGGPESPDFDAELDSNLERIDLGIDGLDRMIQGGVPVRSLLVVMGPAGSGKTTFGLQFLYHALEQGENTVFITLEESKQRVINSATEKGYAFDEYVESGQLAVVDVDPVEMANSLTSIRNELPRLIENFGASRLVLDSVSLLEMMYESRAKRRNEIYDFSRSLKEAGVTAMLTSEAAEESAYVSRYGIVEYLTDAVFVLQYVRPDDFRETRLAVEIQKIRDANHSREKKPYEITDEGLSVYQQANLF